MSKIRIRMLDDYNLPPEIDISTQRWHVLMRQNRGFSLDSLYAYLFHINGQLIITNKCFVTVSNEFNVLTYYIPPYECTQGILWFSRRYAATSAASNVSASTSYNSWKLLTGVLPHVICRLYPLWSGLFNDILVPLNSR